jgi:hypothetical protein
MRLLVFRLRMGGTIVESQRLPRRTSAESHLETAFKVFLVALCSAWLIFIRRTWKAYRLRIGIMKDDLDLYFRLPSLSLMVFKFWRPLSSFVEEAREATRGEESKPPQTKQLG